MALFGAPGSSKSSTLTIAARLFQFWKHRTAALGVELKKLEVDVAIYVWFHISSHNALFHRATQANARAATRIPQAFSLATTEGKAKRSEYSRNLERIKEIRKLLQEYQTVFNKQFSRLREESDVDKLREESDVKASDVSLATISSTKRTLSLCITFNKTMPLSPLRPEDKAESQSMMMAHLNVRFVYAFAF